MNKIIAGIIAGFLAVLFSGLYISLAAAVQPNLLFVHCVLACTGSLIIWKIIYPFAAWIFDITFSAINS